MVILTVIYILLIVITALVGYTVVQIKLYGMNVKDFYTFVKSIQDLEVLYKFSKSPFSLLKILFQFQPVP